MALLQKVLGKEVFLILLSTKDRQIWVSVSPFPMVTAASLHVLISSLETLALSFVS